MFSRVWGALGRQRYLFLPIWDSPGSQKYVFLRVWGARGGEGQKTRTLGHPSVLPGGDPMMAKKMVRRNTFHTHVTVCVAVPLTKSLSRHAHSADIAVSPALRSHYFLTCYLRLIVGGQ